MLLYQHKPTFSQFFPSKIPCSPYYMFRPFFSENLQYHSVPSDQDQARRRPQAPQPESKNFPSRNPLFFTLKDRKKIHRNLDTKNLEDSEYSIGISVDNFLRRCAPLVVEITR